MDLLTYISDVPRREALAKACGTDPNYLWQVATGWRGRRASPKLAERIELETERLGPEKVTKESVIFPSAAREGFETVVGDEEPHRGTAPSSEDAVQSQGQEMQAGPSAPSTLSEVA